MAEDAAAAGGEIEMFGRTFISGWVKSDESDFYLEIRIGDAPPITHTQFAPRRVNEPFPRGRAKGFVHEFDFPLKDGDQVSVKLNTGEEMEGSPFIYRRPEPTHVAVSEHVRVHVECPKTALYRRIATVSGWMLLNARLNDVSFLVDGVEQDARIGIRPDVVEHFATPLALGWEFTCNVAETVRTDGIVNLKMLLNGAVVFERSIIAHLEPKSDALVLFMHIPKTAGSSLAGAIKAQSRIESHWLYGSVRRPVERHVADLLPSAFGELELLGGHFTYGLHRDIQRRCLYISVLRSPLDYIKSYFLYRKYVQRWPAFLNLDIYEALDSRLDHLLDNGMTRFFAPKSPADPVTADDLRRAMAVMAKNFAFVGLVERMEETVARVSAILRADLDVRTENRTPETAEAASIDPEKLARRAEPYIVYDRALYQHAKSLFW